MATITHVSSARTTPWFKLLATNASADGTYIVEATVTMTETRPTNMIPTISPSGVKFRGIEIMPFGTDAADETVYHIFSSVQLVTDWGQDNRPNYDFVHGLDAQYIIRPITELITTLGATADGSAGAYITATDFTGDTITQANKTTYGTQLESAFGQTSVLNSPTGDVIGASYWLPDFGNADFLILDYDKTSGSSATGNALIKLYA